VTWLRKHSVVQAGSLRCPGCGEVSMGAGEADKLRSRVVYGQGERRLRCWWHNECLRRRVSVAMLNGPCHCAKVAGPHVHWTRADGVCAG
jgi:hypothetical protein